MVYVHLLECDSLFERRPNSLLTGVNSLAWWFGRCFLSGLEEAVSSGLGEHSGEMWSPAGFQHRPCERSSTYFSCRRRSPGGELLAEGGQVAEMDQLPGAALRFYEQEPSKQEVGVIRSTGQEHPSDSHPTHGGDTHQPATLATQACILEPGPHVLVRADH